jgi:hypothetical protein
MKQVTAFAAIRNSNRYHLLILSLVYSALLARLVWFVDRYAVNVLFWDQWDFLVHLFQGNLDLWDHFTLQHGPHRQGLGGVILAILYPLSGWNVRVEAFVAVAIVSISCLLALAVKGRLFGKFHWADCVIPLAYFTLLQYEIYAGAPNLAHGPVPILLVTLIAFVLTLKTPRIKAVFLAILVLLTTYTGFALFSGLAVIGWLLVFSIKSSSRGEKCWNAFALVLSVAFFCSFFHAYQHAPAVDCFQFPHPKPLEYLEFACVQFGSAWGAPSPLSSAHRYYTVMLYSAGMLALLLAVFGFYTYRAIKQMDEKSIVISYLCMFSLLFLAFTAVGRVCLGLPTATSSRYVPYSTPAVVAIYFGVLSAVMPLRSKRAGYACITLLVVLSGAKEISSLRNSTFIQFTREGKAKWVQAYLEVRNIDESNRRAQFKVYPVDERIEQKIEYLEENKLSFFRDAE